MTDYPMDELADWCRTLALTGVAAIAAELVRAGSTQGGLEIHTKSTPSDFVTAADLASEKAILGRLELLRPDDEVLAEESGSRSGSSGLRWLIDPVDGTMNFVHGRREHAVSVGVEPVGDGLHKAGQLAVAGAVALPALREVYWGTDRSAFVSRITGAGDAAPPHLEPLAVSDCDRLGDAIVGIGYPRGAAPRAAAHVWFGGLLDDIRDYRRIGSSACDLVNVASGVQDGYLAFGVQPWDVAGGFALVRAAGGRASWIRTAGGLDVAVAGTAPVFDALSSRVSGCELRDDHA